MQATLNRVPLWSYREAAEIFGLDTLYGPRTIAELAKQHGLSPKRITGNPRLKGMNRADLEVLARALNKSLDWPDSAAS